MRLIFPNLLISVVYIAAIFLSAILIFLIEPMIPKAILPLMGGTPATWITALMFYQAILFLGYSYCFLLTRWAPHWSQAVIHLAVLAVAATALPPALPPASPWLANLPALQVLYMLTVAAGMPLFALSATAPLLQHWFARTDHTLASDPYFLYAASNVGGLGALVAYPVLIEPHVGLGSQAKLWTMGFVLVAVTIAACIVLTTGPARVAQPINPRAAATSARSEPRPLMWLILAAVPSSLLSGTTTRITTDIAAGPLFWVVPLGLYLLTFVLAFSRRRILPMRLMLLLQPAFLVPVVMVGFGALARIGAWPMVAATLILLFLSAYICHVRLVDSRPGPERTTQFYLMIALGGLIGGSFNALVAPNVFNGVAEYPLALVLVMALRPKNTAPGFDRDLVISLGVGTGLAVALLADPSDQIRVLVCLVGFVVALGLMGMATVPVRFVAGLAVAFAVAGMAPYLIAPALYQGRNFFGVVKVLHARADDMNMELNGGVVHGEQLRAPSLRRNLTSYYSESGPYGDVISVRMAHQQTDSVAAIGLGAGTVACSRFPDARWTFYEINPIVVQLALNTRYFSFLADCQPQARILVGDGRLLLAEETQRFDLIVLDAFSSDAIPVHLLTLEAFSMYLQKLRPGGMIAINVSNHFVDLNPVLAAVAKRLNLTAVWRFDGTKTVSTAPSKWVVIAREPETVTPFLQRPGWNSLEPDGTQLWTDDRSGLFPLLIFGSRPER